MTSEVIDIAVEHEEIFYQSAEFWVGASFVLIVCLLFMPVSKKIKEMINHRIDRIKNELQEAENLKLDAQKLYAEYERKFINTENEVNDIIESQKRAIEQTKEKRLQELDQLLRRKQTETTSRIDVALEQAKKEINEKICQNSLDILYQIIRLKLTKTDYNRFIDKSINNIKNLEIGKRNG